MQEYLDYLSDLTEQERSVFLFCFVLKISKIQTAKSLNYTQRFVIDTCRQINSDIDSKPIKDEIIEAFAVHDLL